MIKETNILTGGKTERAWTEKEASDHASAVRADEEKITYATRRRNELVELDGEGMDAMREAIEGLAAFLVADLPEKYIEYAEKVARIKDMYRKPEK